MAEYDSPPFTTADIIRQLHLQKHPEGGYFVETDRQEQEIASPYADGALRSLATSIFYFLTHEEPGGVFHMNKSVTQHVLHHGRAQYTLITPSNPPKIETVVLGTNAAAGELRQLIVGTGVWKRSCLLPADLAAAKSLGTCGHLGCLITEVVTPGFHWEYHAFLTHEGLQKLFQDVEGGEDRIWEFEKFLKK